MPSKHFFRCGWTLEGVRERKGEREGEGRREGRREGGKEERREGRRKGEREGGKERGREGVKATLLKLYVHVISMHKLVHILKHYPLNPYWYTCIIQYWMYMYTLYICKYRVGSFVSERISSISSLERKKNRGK